MATHNRHPSPLSLYISEQAYRFLRLVDEFFPSLPPQARRTDQAALTHADAIREIERHRRCPCGGSTCATCQHIIKDVLGS